MTYELTLLDRTLSVEVVETPEGICVNITVSKYGEFATRADERRYEVFMDGILTPFDADLRPIIIRHPLTGQVATVYDDHVVVEEGGRVIILAYRTHGGEARVQRFPSLVAARGWIEGYGLPVAGVAILDGTVLKDFDNPNWPSRDSWPGPTRKERA